MGYAMFAFVETAPTEAWSTGADKPAAVLQTLLPGQTLRVVGDSRPLLSELASVCSSNGLTIVRTSEDRVLTIEGCYSLKASKRDLVVMFATLMTAHSSLDANVS
jgi:hypothetical protein